MPIIDDSQHTYGLTVLFTPGNKGLPRVGRSFRKIGSLLSPSDSRDTQ